MPSSATKPSMEPSGGCGAGWNRWTADSYKYKWKSDALLGVTTKLPAERTTVGFQLSGDKVDDKEDNQKPYKAQKVEKQRTNIIHCALLSAPRRAVINRKNRTYQTQNQTCNH